MQRTAKTQPRSFRVRLGSIGISFSFISARPPASSGYLLFQMGKIER